MYLSDEFKASSRSSPGGECGRARAHRSQGGANTPWMGRERASSLLTHGILRGTPIEPFLVKRGVVTGGPSWCGHQLSYRLASHHCGRACSPFASQAAPVSLDKGANVVGPLSSCREAARALATSPDGTARQFPRPCRTRRLEVCLGKRGRPRCSPIQLVHHLGAPTLGFPRSLHQRRHGRRPRRQHRSSARADPTIKLPLDR